MEFEVHGRIKGNLFNDKSISQDPIKLEGNNPNFYAYTFDSNSHSDPYLYLRGIKYIVFVKDTNTWGDILV